MYVEAHTNVPGVHLLHDWRIEESTGTVYDIDTGTLVPYHHVDDSYSQVIAESRKPEPFQGNRHTAYDYWRGVSRVIEDRPYVLRSHWANPSGALDAYYDIYRNEFISKRHVPFGNIPYYTGPSVDDAWAESVTKALNNLKGRETADIGNSLGELHTTVDALSKSVMRGANFIRHMRGGRWAKAADDLGISRRAFKDTRGKVLADYWLAYSYGWAPLAGSMYDLSSTVAELVNRNSNFIESTGTSIVSGERDFPHNDWKVLVSWAVRVRTVLKATLTNSQLYLINETGLSNPAAVAWEIVPFSFVVDWFVPVGNTLSALTADMGLTWHGGYITKVVRMAMSITHNAGYINPWTDCTEPGLYKEKQSEMQRVALTGFPYPLFYADKSPYSTPRALNALALVRSLT